MTTYRRGFDTNMDVKGARKYDVRTFYLKPGTETSVVLVDDDPVVIVQHMLFMRNDPVAMGMRQTCWGFDPNTHKELCPRDCLVCNSSLRHQDIIGRRPVGLLTVIDERAFTHNGKNYKDQKLILELDKRGIDIFKRRKEAEGGRLAGMRFRVFRSQSDQSVRYGDSWDKLGFVEPGRHFWPSPAIPKIVESAQRNGRVLTHQQAVAELVTPFNYEIVRPPYRPEDAERFVAFVEGGGKAGGGGARGGHTAGGEYQAPPFPGGSPDYSVAVPAGQVPAHAPPPPASYAPPPAPTGPLSYPPMPAASQGQQYPPQAAAPYPTQAAPPQAPPQQTAYAPPPMPPAQPTGPAYGSPPSAPPAGYQTPPMPQQAPVAPPPQQYAQQQYQAPPQQQQQQYVTPPMPQQQYQQPPPQQPPPAMNPPRATAPAPQFVPPPLPPGMAFSPPPVAQPQQFQQQYPSAYQPPPIPAPAAAPQVAGQFQFAPPDGAGWSAAPPGMAPQQMAPPQQPQPAGPPNKNDF